MSTDNASSSPTSSSTLPSSPADSSFSSQFVWLGVKPFVLGGVSASFAQICIQPVDMVKIRIQLSGEGGNSAVVRNPLTMARMIIVQEGPLKLYAGLSAALLRQITYGTARLGTFRTLTNWAQRNYYNTAPTPAAASSSSSSKSSSPSLPLSWRVACGLSAGAIASVVGVPADVALVRMQADTTLPAADRRHYRGVFDALRRIVSEEGVSGLFRGCVPTVVRAMALNGAMLSSYDQSKEFFETKFGVGQAANMSASIVAGFFATSASLPFDFIKTRLQKQKQLSDGTFPYKNATDCVLKTIRYEGPFAFYRGFVTYLIRIAPHAIITLNTLEFLNRLCKQMGI